jgi:subtilase family serine protease
LTLIAIFSLGVVRTVSAQSAPVDGLSLTLLAHHVPKFVGSSYDEGTTPTDKVLPDVAILLARSPEQELALQSLLEEQSDKSSAKFHSWLTPEDFAQQFGASAAAIDTICRWLEGYGLVPAVSRSKMYISVVGNVGQLSAAFHTSFHTFLLSGEPVYSLTTEPQIPVAVSGYIASISGLSQFPMTQKNLRKREWPAETLTNGNHVIAPADFAAIYDINPIYNAGYTGAGQSIAIVGESRVAKDDIQNFAAYTNLTLTNPVVVLPPGSVDPGETNDDAQGEATLDVTRASSVAPGAAVSLVINAESNGGIGLPLRYVIDNQVASILTVSFYGCEVKAGQANTDFYNALFSQGAAEGITTFISAGDGGVDSCESPDSVPEASQTASINDLCASPNVTCVGGTEFIDSNSSLYWKPTNGTGHESAIGYIPEGAFNDPINTGSGAYQIFAGGGGISSYIPAPSWQAGLTGNSTGFRTVPDISLSSSGHDGYLICQGYEGYPCVPNTQGITVVESIAGTSAATPSMAGIQALLNQKEGSRQGNINPALYNLATTPTNGVFHDVTIATSGVTNCSTAAASLCNNSTPSPTSLQGGEAGFVVASGYDLATGWGSIDAYGLLVNWNSVTKLATATVDLSLSQTLISAGQSVTFTASLLPNATPTGNIQFTLNGQAIGAPVSVASGNAVLTYSQFGTTQDNYVQAVYSGDSVYAPAISNVMEFVVNPAGSPGFSVTATPITIASPGQSGTSSITVSPVGSFSGTVTFSCISLTGVTLGSCVFTPSSLAIGNGPAQTELTLMSVAPSAGLTPIDISHAAVRKSVPSTLPTFLSLSLFGILILRRRSFAKSTLPLLALAILGASLVSCSRTGTTVTITSALNPGTTQEAISFQAIVSGPAGSAVPTGSVQFLSNGVTTGAPVAITSGAATLSQTFTTAGTYAMSAQYLGSSTFGAALSPGINETISYKNPGTQAGTYSLLVQAVSGTASQTIPVSVTVQ